MKNLNNLRFISKFISMILFQGTILFVLFQNIKPFGAILLYASNVVLPGIGPKDRVEERYVNNEKVLKQLDDLIYFSTKVPFEAKKAKVKIVFKNQDPEQKLYIGYQDQNTWHYTNYLVDDSSVSFGGFVRVGVEPTLYQRNKKFGSVEEFFNNLPKEAVIGLYDYDKEVIMNTHLSQLTDYQPKNDITVISTPIRGSYVMYVYVDNEPFNMTIEKQDLNWYTGKDEMKISVYKEGDLVYETNIPDDGEEGDTKEVLPPKKVSIKNPGPDLPESGVYKVVVQASGDIITNNISSNLHKIIFQGPLFLAQSSPVYPFITSKGQNNQLYSNSMLVKVKTLHTVSFQELTFGDTLFPLNEINNEQTIIPHAGSLYQIQAPKGDIVLDGMGYFSFSKDQFFLPTPYTMFDIKKPEDFKYTDYILTNYKVPKEESGWKVAELDIDLSKAVFQKEQLSWLIKAPGIKENNRTIYIKSIDVTYIKDPIIKDL